MLGCGISDNEKGGLLPYALMITLVITLLSTPLLNMVMTRQLNDVRSKNDKIATSLAVSNVEEFIAYLKRCTGCIPVNYFKKFAFNGEQINNTIELENAKKISAIVLPDSTKVTLSMYYESKGNDKYNVITKVVSGDDDLDNVKDSTDAERLAREKIISYEITAINSPISSGSGGGTSQYNSIFNFDISADGEGSNDTNGDNVLTWNEIKNLTSAESFDTFFNDILDDLVGEGEPTRPYDYSVNTIEELISLMSTDQVKDSDGQISLLCDCPAFDFKDHLNKGTVLDFSSGPYSDTVFIVHFKNSISQTDGSLNALWKMNGMMLIDGDLNLNDKFLEVTHVVVNGTVDPSNGDKQYSFFAANTYDTNSSTNPKGTTSTFTYESMTGSPWNPSRQN